jgi:metal-sulfur cluster biosynthetic enzyme
MMMDSGGPKENANPTLRPVKEKTRYRDGSADNSAGGSSFLLFSDNKTPEDRAVRKALRDAATAVAATATRDNPSNNSLSFLLQSVDHLVPSSSSSSNTKHSMLPLLEFGTRPRPRLNKQKNKKIENQQQKQKQSSISEPIDASEIFEMIRNIQDPEHPHTLEELGVVSESQITIDPVTNQIDVRFTPTIPHCSMATLIGLCIRVKLWRSGLDQAVVATTTVLSSSSSSSQPQRPYHITVRIEPGTHNSEDSVNKQLADKERVCAALENQHLLGVVNQCIAAGMKHGGRNTQ